MSSTSTTQIVRPARTLQGSVTLPGDKSISHRYAMLAGIAAGTTRLSNFSTGADPIPPSPACRPSAQPSFTIQTRPSRSQAPQAHLSSPLHRWTAATPDPPCACSQVSSRLTRTPSPSSATTPSPSAQWSEFASLSAQMGARIDLVDGHAPITIHGGPLHAIDFDTPIPSAQVKTAVLFAGLQADGTTSLTESVRTRDHSEHALRAFGATLNREAAEAESITKLASQAIKPSMLSTQRSPATSPPPPSSFAPPSSSPTPTSSSTPSA